MSDARIQKILVAVDFSETSAAALRQAVALAKSLGAAVTVVHVLTNLREALEKMPAAARWKLVAGDIDEFERELRQDSDRQLDEMIAPFADVKLERETLVGKAHAELVRAVLRDRHDLVIAGTQGLSMVKKLFVGSTAQKLVQCCPAPVWIVPPGGDRPLSKILAPVDYSDASAKALGYAGLLAERHQAALHVLHVLDDKDLLELPQVAEQPDKQLSAYRRELKKSSSEHLHEFVAARLPASVTPEYLLAHGAPWQMIDSNAKRLDADLIVLGSVGRGGLAGLFLGNTAERVLAAARRPLLIVKPDEFVTPIEPSIFA